MRAPIALLLTGSLILSACNSTPANQVPEAVPTPAPKSKVIAGLTVPDTIDPRNADALLTASSARASSLTALSLPAYGIISNGVVQLGINATGNLNVPGTVRSTYGTGAVGLRYVATNNESTAAGCLCEGWGVADVTSGAVGYANAANGVGGLTVTNFTLTADSAVSTVIAGGVFEVTHDYHPSPLTPNLYEVTVTIKNITADKTLAPRYRRVMDWDVEPTPFNEYVTIKRGTSPQVFRTDNNGFNSGNPLTFTSYGRLNVDFEDDGPKDHGALFDFEFATLAPGASMTFKTYYGGAPDEAAAKAALGTVGAEAYSLGQPSTAAGPTLGTPNTFMFGFAGIGGKPIEPPTTNRAPTAVAGGPYSGAEGSAISFDASGSSDPDAGDTLTYAWDLDGDGDYDDGTGATLTHTFTDNRITPAVGLKVTDSNGLSATSTAALTVTNVAPVVSTPVPSTLIPVPVNTSVSISAAFSDAGTADTHTATLTWDDGTVTPGAVTGSGGTGSASGSRTFTRTGVYSVTTTVTDDDSGVGSSTYDYVVVYDPAAGFVTGGGWINSPAGAYAADPTLSGKANFGFMSKYQKGATVPTGNTEFQFHAGNFNFQSSAYQWLTISGARAQYKGTGTVNGAGGYSFLLTAVDGQVTGGGGADKFRLKVWETATSAVVYDNQMLAADSASLTTTLAGGSIVIHSK